MRGGGAERVMLDLAHEFKKSGLSVTFVLRNARGHFLDEARANFGVTDLGSSRVRYSYRPLRRWIVANRPNTVLANLWPSGAVAWLAARGTSTKVIPVEHSVLSRQYAGWTGFTNFKLRQSVRRIYPRAQSVIGVSKGVARDLETIGKLKGGSVMVINNPVQPPRRVRDEEAVAAAADWPGREGPRLLAVGNLKPAKNHALLLQAFSKLRSAQTARLLILGEGPLRKDLEELAMTLGITDRVAMPGFRADPAPFYMAADLFVMSSDFEGFGNVIVEAMSYGLPVVSTDCPTGPSEILESGRYGHLVPVGDPLALASGIESAIGQDHDKRRLIARSREFSPEKAARSYLELISGDA